MLGKKLVFVLRNDKVFAKLYVPFHFPTPRFRCKVSAMEKKVAEPASLSKKVEPNNHKITLEIHSKNIVQNSKPKSSGYDSVFKSIYDHIKTVTSVLPCYVVCCIT